MRRCDIAYKGQRFENARTYRVVVLLSNAEYEAVVARAEAQTDGNMSLYIRSQLFGAEQTQASASKHKEHA